jgi:hypothetical protein
MLVMLSCGVGQSDGLILLPCGEWNYECRMMACSCCIVMMVMIDGAQKQWRL